MSKIKFKTGDSEAKDHSGQKVYNVKVNKDNIGQISNLINEMASSGLYDFGISISDIGDDYKEGMSFKASAIDPSVSSEVGFTAEEDRHRAGNDKTIHHIIRDSMPRDKKGKIRRAFMWVEQDDLLNSVLKLKTDFTISGFGILGKPENAENVVYSVNQNEDNTSDISVLSTEIKGLIDFQTKLNKISRKWDITPIIRQLIFDWYTSDSMILYWKVDKTVVNGQHSDSSDPNALSEKNELMPGLIDISAINPGDVNWSNSFGNDILHVDLPDELIKKVQDIKFAQSNKAEYAKKRTALLESGIPERYIEAIEKGETEVELRREDGDNWLVQTLNRKHHGLATPSMSTIFISLLLRSMLKEGDFAAAFLMKHFILHVTCGEKIESGPLAGSKQNWATEEDIISLHAEVTKSSKALRLVTNHTVRFNFVFPPKEMFDGTKYIKHESIIKNWVGVSDMIMTGEGGKYAGGFMSTKRIVAEILYIRDRINWIIGEFFDHPTIKQGLDVPDNTIVSGLFDENVLKEAGQLLNELRFMLSEGLGDPSIAISELGRDVDLVKRTKIISINENRNSKVWEPVFQRRNEREVQEGKGHPRSEDHNPTGDSGPDMPRSS